MYGEVQSRRDTKTGVFPLHVLKTLQVREYEIPSHVSLSYLLTERYDNATNGAHFSGFSPQVKGVTASTLRDPQKPTASHDFPLFL